MCLSTCATVALIQREGCQQFVALPYVHSIRKQYLKSHEPHYLTYIQIINFQISQNSSDWLPSSWTQSCTHNLWCGDIWCTVNTLIDVKFPERSFEFQQFADVHRGTSPLRFVRTITFPFQKYRDIFVTFISRDLKHKFVIFIWHLTKVYTVIWLTSTMWFTDSNYISFCWQFLLHCINELEIFENEYFSLQYMKVRFPPT